MTQSSEKLPHLPDRLQGLAALAANLLWSWRRDTRALFREVDPGLWHITRHNPLELLNHADPARLEALAADSGFIGRYDAVHEAFERELGRDDLWFREAARDVADSAVAYFSAEFGLHNSVPIYSGGLGVLAGDHCKAASDLGVPLVGVGLLYTRGYFDQRLRLDGWQEDSEDHFDPGLTPLDPVVGPDGQPHLTSVTMSGREVKVGAWRILVGRVPVYLLDTDLDANEPTDRELSHQLYAGGPDLRLRQEWLLGVGGVRVLRALGIEPAAWHANEGHAAFMLVERVRELVQCGVPVEDAVRRVRTASVFTTHTPVPAGHDVFRNDQIEACAGPVWDEMGMDRESFMRLGYHPELDGGAFHMTAMAIRLSGRVNSVAERHSRETRRIWHTLWPGRAVDDVPIGHVTNGVHLMTWMSHRMQELLDHHLGLGWNDLIDDPAVWDRVLELDPNALWQAHTGAKGNLLRFVREEARRRWRDQWEDAAHVVGAGTLLDPDVMTIGFARRFATYKRADLLFRDPDRLRRLLVNAERPVQIIFAGKAHPADDPGKQVLRRVYQFAHDSSVEGRIAFLEDYELHMAHRLVQGVDLWLNVPVPPMEACGTSGMKAALNGVPQLSTHDGWWAEGHTGSNGWVIPLSRSDGDRHAADAEQLYSLLENEVVPLFYQRDRDGVAPGWIERMRHAIHVAGSRFTARRMVRQYVTDRYLPAMRGEDRGDAPPTG